MAILGKFSLKKIIMRLVLGASTLANAEGWSADGELDARNDQSSPLAIENGEQGLEGSESKLEFESLPDPFELPIGNVGSSEFTDGAERALSATDASDLETSALDLQFQIGILNERVPLAPPSDQYSQFSSYSFLLNLGYRFCQICAWPVSGWVRGGVSYPTRVSRLVGQSISQLTFEFAAETSWNLVAFKHSGRIQGFSELSLKTSRRQFPRHVLSVVAPELWVGARWILAEEWKSVEPSPIPTWILSLNLGGTDFVGRYQATESEPLDVSDRAFEARPEMSWSKGGEFGQWAVKARVVRAVSSVFVPGAEASVTGPYVEVLFSQAVFGSLLNSDSQRIDRRMMGRSVSIGWMRMLP